MNLYKLSQEKNDAYDTYDSCIVAAMCEGDAVNIHPNGTLVDWNEDTWGSWAYKKEDVRVELIGKAVDGTEAGLILSSYNAG